ncbi:pyrophosphatase PpaX [Paenibacillus larvae subsp. larvae]|uniref:Pyrophosphatase PpaX n=1 Tax=Paenibacillus larvae subsp. larvae TaxID=147375 RepID=A0A2L1TV23_9BACL|nr:pyrophosphatase PpaX [Paenibacillus larvae]AQZ47220.1 pyrophosphatase PpaX [Paenibacillus larvae subsp. pulvifaciens]AVF24515.1 pyrophosphatase PpaX [Paenibacillus larvae subsp. larvae]AVF29276.1 pyrophosphatase PpaX [Paenibacillus larvae subsp. larvae]MBH0344722.1 pyrophosphatase [Paenibacillus larvae]MCY7521990.1 pyrophosphatase PpaX [Paenibacillus larvae]
MINTLLFDLDGTILDTNELIIQSFIHALQGQTSTPLDREAIILQMGRPLTEQLQFFSGRDEVTDLITLYRTFNYDQHDRYVRAFPHVKEVLARIHSRGVKLGVVTSKIRRTTELGLELSGLSPYLDVIVTIDDVRNPKPDPEGIHLAISRFGSVPEETIMVGDSHYDIEAARNAGVASVAVGWSLKGEAYLRQYHPDHLIQDMRDLYGLVGIKEDQGEEDR